MHEPERTCVGCRTRRPQSELLRLRRRADGQLVPARRVDAGRSAYLCPTRGCYDRAVSRHGFARSFRGRISYDAGSLWGALVSDSQPGAKGGRDDG